MLLLFFFLSDVAGQITRSTRRRRALCRCRDAARPIRAPVPGRLAAQKAEIGPRLLTGLFFRPPSPTRALDYALVLITLWLQVPSR